MKTRKIRTAAVFVAILILVGCGDSPTTPSAPPPPPVLQISGFVSQFVVVPSASGNFADINYEVTITSSRSVTGCFIEVKWLNADDLQVGRTFLAAGVAVPAGTSKMTSQDFVRIEIALSIKDSRVEFALCD